MKIKSKLTTVSCLVVTMLAMACDAAIKMPLPDGTRIIDVSATGQFKSIESALEHVKEIRKTDCTTPLAVRVESGEYSPSRKIVINGTHSRTNWAELIVFAADFDKPPCVRGGVPLKDWKRVTFNGRSDVWCADANATVLQRRPKLLFFNNQRMQPARWPNLDKKHPYTSGYAFADTRGFTNKSDRFAGTGLFSDEIQVRPGDERTWAHPQDAWVIVYARHNWWNNMFDILSVSNNIVYVRNNHREIRDNLFPWDRWCVENMAEELDVPGEWYYDTRAHKVYLISPDGTDPNKVPVTIARAGAILNVASGNCTIAGIEFACGSEGVTVSNADNVKVLGCKIHDIGSHQGVGVRVRGHNVRVADCDIYNIGEHGVIVHVIGEEQRITDRMNVVVENNYVHHCGVINSHGIGIWITGQGTRVSHNLIHDMPRCGLIGYGRFCEISYNRVRHVNTINDDTGAIYDGGWTSGVGTKVCYNWFSDSIGFQRQHNGRYRLHKGACGIYPDEGCGGLEVYGNLIESCHHAAMHLHNGRWITISNNVFVSNGSLPTDGGSFQLSLQTWNTNTNGYFVRERRAAFANEYYSLMKNDPRWREFPSLAQPPDKDEVFSNDGTSMMGVKVFNNIMAYPDQGVGMALRAWNLNTSTNFFNRNLYWPGNGNRVVMATGRKEGNSWEAWQAAGEDTESVIADPLFRNAAGKDFRLQPDSPAFKLGFVELPYEKMGLQKSLFRPAFPKEAEGVREHPEWLRDDQQH